MTFDISMAITTIPEEAAATEHCHSLGTIFEEVSLRFGTITLELLVRVFSAPKRLVTETEKCRTAKGFVKESGKEKEDIGRQCEKPFLPRKVYEHVSKTRPPFQRFCPMALASIFMLLLPSVIAYGPNCTIWQGMRNDATLDVLDVRAFLTTSGIFDVSNSSYGQICPDAFTYAPVEHIILASNNVSYLPVHLFRGISNLKQIELQDNPFTEVPSALNSSETIEYLNLAGSKIKMIEKYSINSMSGLTVLDLSRTEISIVPEDIFDMSLNLVHLSQTKLDRLPLPLPTSVAFNVTLVRTHGNELSISFPGSVKRKIGINITGIETLTCENAKAAVEMSYNVVAGEIVCDHGSFRKINILLKGKEGVVPSRALEENTNNTKGTMSVKVAGDVFPHTPVPNQGAANPCPDSDENTVPLPLVIIIAVICLIVGGLIAGTVVFLVISNSRATFKTSEASSFTPSTVVVTTPGPG